MTSLIVGLTLGAAAAAVLTLVLVGRYRTQSALGEFDDTPSQLRWAFIKFAWWEKTAVGVLATIGILKIVLETLS